MSELQSKSEPTSEVEAALLDAELFVKYGAPERAIKRLRGAIERAPRSIPVRERLREVAASHRHTEEAARQCLALASLYIEREDFEIAYDRLLEAKQLDQRINIAAGLDAIRRARRPELHPGVQAPETRSPTPSVTLAGDLSAISVFDVVQVVENAKLTGSLNLINAAQQGQLFFNEGVIVDADCAGQTGEPGFQRIVELTSGTFAFEKAAQPFAVKIRAASNTNLILDSLRHLDEKKK